MDGPNGFELRRKHLLDISGRIVGDPFISLVALDKAFQDARAELRVQNRSENSRVARLVRYVSEQTVRVRPADAIITFLRDRGEIYLLKLQKNASSSAGDGVFGARLTVMEPLAVSRRRRILAEALVECRPDEDGELYSATIRVFDEATDRYLASYDGLVLLDKVLSRIVAPARTERGADTVWEG